jgi:hypothetical protein
MRQILTLINMTNYIASKRNPATFPLHHKHSLCGSTTNNERKASSCASRLTARWPVGLSSHITRTVGTLLSQPTAFSIHGAASTCYCEHVNVSHPHRAPFY